VRTFRAFESDLDFFLKKFRPVDVNELIHYGRSGKQPEKPGFMMTFDDGLREIYEYVAPLLYKKGIPALIFVNPMFIGNRDMFYRYKASILKEFFLTRNLPSVHEKIIRDLAEKNGVKYDRSGNFLFALNYNHRKVFDDIADTVQVNFNEYLTIQRPYMNHAQISELSAKGFTIGAHSLDHPSYADISTADQIMQTQKSMEQVSEQFKQIYHLFAFPFTDHGIGVSFFKTLFDSEKSSADLMFGTAGIKNDRFKQNLQRIPMEVGNFSAEEIIKGEYLYYLFKMPLGKNLIRRQ